MGLLWMSLRVRWRRAWLPSLGLGLLIGVVGSFVLAAAASARRVEGTYQALLRDIRAPDVMVIPGCVPPASGQGCVSAPEELSADDFIQRLLQLPVVDDVRLVESVLPFVVDAGGEPLLANGDDQYGCLDDDRAVSVLPLNAGGPLEQPVPFRLDGRLPKSASTGVVLAHATAAREGLATGDSVFLAGWCPGDGGDPVTLARPIEMVITGLSVGPLDIEPPGTGLTIEPAYIDRTVFEQLLAAGAEPQQNTAVWIDHAADPAAVADALAEYTIELDLRQRAAVFDSVLATDARLLWLLAGVGLVSGLLLLAPLIGANLRTTSRDTTILAALGSNRQQLASQALLHVATLAVIGAFTAALLTAPISALMPRGFATAIAPHRQLWFDAPITLAGASMLVVVVVALAVLPVRSVSDLRRPTATTRSADRSVTVGSTRLPPSVQAGVQAAIGVPAGPRQASPWPSLISLSVAGTTCVASLTYLAGVDRLRDESSLVGWNWDAAVSFDPESADDMPSILANVARVDGIDQMTAGTLYPPAFPFEPQSGTTIWPWSFDTGPDAITSTILSGRAPLASHEIAIDDVFARHAGLVVGDTVTLVRPTLAAQLSDDLHDRLDEFGITDVEFDPPDDQPIAADFEVIGRTVLPLQRSQVMSQAAFTLNGLAEFIEPDDDEINAARAWLPVDLPPEVRAEADALLANLDIRDRSMYLRVSGDRRKAADEVARIDGVSDVIAPTSDEVLTLIVGLNLARTDRIPVALTNVVSGAAAILLVVLLAVSIRARHREIAIMRTLGMPSPGVRWSIVAHATTTAIVPLLIAIPAGVAVGRWAWTTYARDLEVSPSPVTPWATIGLVVLTAIAIANAAALASSRSLIKRSVGTELRAG